MTAIEMYRILGVRYGASVEEIKDAYRRLVKMYHPDVTKTNSSGPRLTKVIEAYKTLVVTSRSKNVVEFPGSKKTAAPADRGDAAPRADIFSLGKLLENGRTVGMRAFAARSLGNTGKRTAYAFLRKALYDPSDLVVRAAVEAIGTLKISQSCGELASTFSRGGREVRESVLAAVEKIGPRGGFRDIVETAKHDPDFSIRSTARRMTSGADKAVSDG
jgi:hypothetical protein